MADREEHMLAHIEILRLHERRVDLERNEGIM